MPLDSTLYVHTGLRPDGRRWNELRSYRAQISPLRQQQSSGTGTNTQSTATGSSYIEQGQTKILCTVTGPTEPPSSTTTSGLGASTGNISVEIIQAAFAANGPRRKRTPNDSASTRLQQVISKALGTALMLHLFPHSTVGVACHILCADGGVMAVGINAAILACVDAGIPLREMVCAVSVGLSLGGGGDDGNGQERGDPLLDVNAQEEQELSYLTVATLGAKGDKVVVLSIDRKVELEDLEGMLVAGIDGCKQLHAGMRDVIKSYGASMAQR